MTTTEEEFWSTIRNHGIFVDRVEVFEGLYEDLLNDDLRDYLLSRRVSVAIVNVDCDLYESAPVGTRSCCPFSEKWNGAVSR